MKNFIKGLMLTTGVLYLSGTVPDKGFTLENNVITAHSNYVLTVNGVVVKKAKLAPDTDYTIVVTAVQ